MEPTYQDSPQCAITFVLNLIGGKWKMPIIWSLSEHESLRYNELRRQVNGITNIMLTRCLTELADYGLIVRTEYSQIPPHVEYALTELGRQLIPSLNMLVEWGGLWKQEAIRRGLTPPEQHKDERLSS